MNNKKFNLIAGLVESTASTGLPDINPWGDGSQLSYLKFIDSKYDTQRNTNISFSGACYGYQNPYNSTDSIRAKPAKTAYSTSFIPSSLSSSGWSFSFWYNVNNCSGFGSVSESNQEILHYAPLDIIIQFSGQRIEAGFNLTPTIASNYEWTNRNNNRHVVVQGKSNRMYVYVDGTLKNSSSNMYYANRSSRRILFANDRAFSQSNTSYIAEQGGISHLRTFTRMLITDEITQLYQQFD